MKKLSRITRKLGMVRNYVCYRMKRDYVPLYPDRLYIESTNRCNLSCLMCPNGRGDMKRKKGVMDLRLFTAIIDEMAGHVSAAVLHIWGEPLLDPNIFAKIRYARSHGVTTELSTNVSLLDTARAEELLTSGLDVVYLCVDGIDKQTYETVRKGACYDETARNAEYLLRQKRSRRSVTPFVNLQLIDCTHTQRQSAAFTQHWKSLGADAINVKPLDTWANQVPDIARLGTTEPPPVRERFHCPNLWYHAHVYWDGTLVSCDRDFNAAWPLGNVRKGVLRAWNSGRMRELRRKHITGSLGDVPACSHCSEWAWWRPGWFSSWGNIPQKKRIS